MANPQLENGHTRIANEILEALCRTRIAGEARQCLDMIIRQTYGYHKKIDRISLSQFQRKTGLNRPSVVRALKKLEKMKMISVIKKDTTSIKNDTNNTNKYVFTKDFEKWSPLEKKVPSIKKDNKPVSKKIHTKDNTKEINTSDEKSSHSGKGKKPTDKPITDWNKYLSLMDDHKGRHINIIALYFREKGLFFETTGKANTAIRRHLRAAKDLSPFTDKEIMDATKQAKKDYADLWTIETLTKILTR